MHTPDDPTPTAKRRQTCTHPGTISATQTCNAAIHGHISWLQDNCSKRIVVHRMINLVLTIMSSQAHWRHGIWTVGLLEGEMVSWQERLPWRPDDSEASVPGIGADSIRYGGSGTGSGRHVAGTGVCCELSLPETETDRLTCVSLCVSLLVTRSDSGMCCVQPLPWHSLHTLADLCACHYVGDRFWLSCDAVIDLCVCLYAGDRFWLFVTVIK